MVSEIDINLLIARLREILAHAATPEAMTIRYCLLAEAIEKVAKRYGEQNR